MCKDAGWTHLNTPFAMQHCQEAKEGGRQAEVVETSFWSACLRAV